MRQASLRSAAASTSGWCVDLHLIRTREQKAARPLLDCFFFFFLSLARSLALLLGGFFFFFPPPLTETTPSQLSPTPFFPRPSLSLDANSARATRQPVRAAAARNEGGSATEAAAERSGSSGGGSGGATRRDQLVSLAALAALSAASAVAPALPASADAKSNNSLSTFEPMAGLEGKNYGKPRTVVEGYKQLPSGLQYADLVEAPSSSDSRELTAEPGDTVTVDWSGVTLGYYGRPFEARNKARGGSFTGDEKDFLRFTLGDGSVIAGFDEAVRGMRVGGFRRAVVPVELGYPGGEFSKVGPKPSNFSGKRALSFVLKNQGLIDKTLLFDVELLRVKKKEG